MALNRSLWNGGMPGGACADYRGADARRAEGALLAKLLAGDAAAFAGLKAQYHNRLVRSARQFVADESIAEEVVQDTWVGVINGLPRFEGRSTLKTWIFRILTNRAKTRGVLEHRTVRLSALSEEDSNGEAAVEAGRFRPNGMWGVPPRRWQDDTPEKLMMTAQAVRHIRRAIAALPSNQRTVVTLRDINGLGSGEVCSLLEISESNQRVLLHRARSKLRAALEEYVERT